MVSAYVDAGFVDATRFGRGDAVALLTYLQMIWVLDPLAYVMCSAAVPISATRTRTAASTTSTRASTAGTCC